MNMKGLIRDVWGKDLKQIMENNVMLLNLQKQILELQIVKVQKRRRQQEIEQKRRKNEERWKEEEQRRKKREREKK